MNLGKNEPKLELIATKTFKEYSEMYKVVDFLNKNLKDKNIMFGLTKNTSTKKMIISIYET
ncbi:YpmA family protein [Desulfolucanica intricata]|uniref:YpmA family protein n=1 Tax=Desulfolucanica intricata TaxID=1285191 RepID=UPI000830898D|nr:YpmA family protein [Desulfolucanica intricata]